jgi:putative FmdB family regulatory protein
VPTYQYACTDCGERLEVVQKFTDDTLTVCPRCEGRLRKMFNAVGIVFKGSGFYRTDSRSSSSSVPAKSSDKTSDKAPEKAPSGQKSGEKPASAPAPSTAPAA